MRLGQKIKGFFGRMGKGIKKGAKWLYDKGKAVVNKVGEYAPKVINTARKVLSVLPSNKYTDVAKKVVEKSDEAYKKGKEYVERGKAAVEAGKRAFNNG